MIRAVRDGRQSSANCIGIDRPPLSGMDCTLLLFWAAIEGWVDVDLAAEESLNGKRDLQGDELPFKQTGFAQREIVCVRAGCFHAGKFEDNDDARLVSARIVLADYACFPQPPNIRNLFGQVWRDLFHGHTRLEPVEGDDAHSSSLEHFLST